MLNVDTQVNSRWCFASYSACWWMFRSFQDRRLGETGAAVGRVQELPRYELRQAIALDSSVLQERHHSEDSDIAETCLSVLSVLSVTLTASQQYTGWSKKMAPLTFV